MDKSNITVTMPVYEYERLNEMEQGYNELIRMFERANIDGKAVLTEELVSRIEEIYL